MFSGQSMDTYSIRDVDLQADIMDFEPNRAPASYGVHSCVSQTTGRLPSGPWHAEDVQNVPDAGLSSSMVPLPYQDLGYAVYDSNVPAYNTCHQMDMDMHNADVCYPAITNMPPTPPDSVGGYSPKDSLEYYSLPIQSKESMEGYDAPQRNQQFVSQDSRTNDHFAATRIHRAENRASYAPRPLASAPQSRDSDNSDVSHASQARSTTSETSQPRDHPHYRRGPDRDGYYRCPKELRCAHKATKQKCNYDKNLDSHYKPYKCKVPECNQAQFSSNACLFRHEREAHGLHGHGKDPYRCKFPNCDRAVEGMGFPRKWNLGDHMRRVHDWDEESSPEPYSDHQEFRPRRRGSLALRSTAIKRSAVPQAKSKSVTTSTKPGRRVIATTKKQDMRVPGYANVGPYAHDDSIGLLPLEYNTSKYCYGQQEPGYTYTTWNQMASTWNQMDSTTGHPY